MTTRLINAEAAGLSEGVNALWLAVRKATTGNFATLASLEAADAALAKLLNSGTTDLRSLRAIIQAEIAAAKAQPQKEAA
jgi:hypothetical protein